MGIYVVVIEDDEDFRDSVCSYLTDVGIHAVGLADAERLEKSLSKHARANVIVCDANLPGESGFSVVARLRIRRPDMGLIMLTARGSQNDRMLGYSLGVDQYMVKPVELPELELIIRNLYRRVSVNLSSDVTQGDSEKAEGIWYLNTKRWELTAPTGTSVRLSASEYQLLSCLIDYSGEVVSRHQILAAMNRPQYSSYARNLDITISRLRRHVREDCGHQLPVVAARGQGYVFTGPVQTSAT